MTDFAHRHGLVYGLATVFIACLTGWLAGVIFGGIDRTDGSRSADARSMPVRNLVDQAAGRLHPPVFFLLQCRLSLGRRVAGRSAAFFQTTTTPPVRSSGVWPFSGARIDGRHSIGPPVGDGCSRHHLRRRPCAIGRGAPGPPAGGHQRRPLRRLGDRDAARRREGSRALAGEQRDPATNRRGGRHGRHPGAPDRRWGSGSGRGLFAQPACGGHAAEW